jgi:hypothetical protein
MNENRKIFFTRDKKGRVVFSDRNLVVGALIDDESVSSSEKTYSIDKILELAASVRPLGGDAIEVGEDGSVNVRVDNESIRINEENKLEAGNIDAGFANEY